LPRHDSRRQSDADPAGFVRQHFFNLFSLGTRYAVENLNPDRAAAT
jgi:hypothetical protein